MKRTLLIMATFLLWLTSYNVGFSQGESCEDPLELMGSGTYTADNSNGDQWFLFVPNADGVVGVRTCDLTTVDTYIYAYVNTCTSYTSSSDDACGSQSRIFMEVSVGDSIRIQFSDQFTSSSYPFEFSYETDIVGGVTCDDPIQISQEGEYFFSEITSNSTIYYEYTVQSDGVLNITDGRSQSNTIYVYDGCENSYINYSYDGELQLEVLAGESYILKWSNDNSMPFYWQVAEFEATNGGTCENAITLSATGEQTFNRSFYFSQMHYTYTATSDAVLEITDNDGNNSVTLRSECGGYSVENNSYGDIEYYLVAGETIIIDWINQTEESFTWNFTEPHGFLWNFDMKFTKQGWSVI